MKTVRECIYCGRTFVAPTRARRYCSTECRRRAQNENRLAERAELREVAESLAAPMTDPWAMESRLGEEVRGNSLTDGWTDCDWSDVEMAGPMACLTCKWGSMTGKKGLPLDVRLICAACNKC